MDLSKFKNIHLGNGLAIAVLASDVIDMARKNFIIGCGDHLHFDPEYVFNAEELAEIFQFVDRATSEFTKESPGDQDAPKKIKIETDFGDGLHSIFSSSGNFDSVGAAWHRPVSHSVQDILEQMKEHIAKRDAKRDAGGADNVQPDRRFAFEEGSARLKQRIEEAVGHMDQAQRVAKEEYDVLVDKAKAEAAAAGMREKEISKVIANSLMGNLVARLSEFTEIVQAAPSN